MYKLTGFYCPRGANKPLLCDEGMYCPYEKLSSPFAECSPGYYCNEGRLTSKFYSFKPSNCNSFLLIVLI